MVWYRWGIINLRSFTIRDELNFTFILENSKVTQLSNWRSELRSVENEFNCVFDFYDCIQSCLHIPSPVRKLTFRQIKLDP